jgi:hypothetical protein
MHVLARGYHRSAQGSHDCPTDPVSLVLGRHEYVDEHQRSGAVAEGAVPDNRTVGLGHDAGELRAAEHGGSGIDRGLAEVGAGRELARGGVNGGLVGRNAGRVISTLGAQRE